MAAKIHMGIILMGGTTEIMDVAPIDMIFALSRQFVDTFPGDVFPDQFKSQALDVDVHWVSEAGKSTPSRLTSNISLNPTDSFETCPSLDIVLIGANNVGYNPTEAELDFVRKSYEECTSFLTICGGVFVAMEAGILDEKTVTGPRFMLDGLRKQTPTTTWVEKRWARDGKLWTSGTLMNGTDLVHAFCAETWGKLANPSLVEYQAQLASWPKRDVDYKDEPWEV